MIEPIQILFILFVLFALSRAYLRYKEGKIRETEFAFWILIWISAIVAIISPGTISLISKFFGIGRASDFIIYIAIILLFYLVFRIYVAIDGIEQKITKIVREVSITREKKK